MRACVDQELCVGCGMCEGIAPEIFQMNAEGKAEAYAEADVALEESVHDAIDSCPVAAISEE